MLTWPHAGFHVHPAVWVPADDRAFATRLARYGARNPVALERLTHDRTAKAVTYRSDKSEGPTAGTEPVDPLEFLARVLVHSPDQGHVTTRSDGWYANRPRGRRDKAAHGVPPRRGPRRAAGRHAPLARPLTPRPSREYASPGPAPPRGRSARATVPPRRPRSPCRPLVTRPDHRPNDPRGTPAPWRARRRPRTEAREAGNRARY